MNRFLCPWSQRRGLFPSSLPLTYSLLLCIFSTTLLLLNAQSDQTGATVLEVSQSFRGAFAAPDPALADGDDKSVFHFVSMPVVSEKAVIAPVTRHHVEEEVVDDDLFSVESVVDSEVRRQKPVRLSDYRNPFASFVREVSRNADIRESQGLALSPVIDFFAEMETSEAEKLLCLAEMVPAIVRKSYEHSGTQRRPIVRITIWAASPSVQIVSNTTREAFHIHQSLMQHMDPDLVTADVQVECAVWYFSRAPRPQFSVQVLQPASVSSL